MQKIIRVFFCGRQLHSAEDLGILVHHRGFCQCPANINDDVLHDNSLLTEMIDCMTQNPEPMLMASEPNAARAPAR